MARFRFLLLILVYVVSQTDAGESWHLITDFKEGIPLCGEWEVGLKKPYFLDDTVSAVTLTPDEKRLVIAYYGSVIQMDLETGKKIGPEIKEPKIEKIALLDSGSTLVTVNKTGTVRYWDILTGWLKRKSFSVLPKGEKSLGFWNLYVSENGRFLVVNCEETYVWDLELGKLIATIKGEHSFYMPAISNEGKYLIREESGGTSIKVRKGDTYEQLHFCESTGYTARFYVSNDTPLLLRTNAMTPNSCLVFDLKTGKIADRFGKRIRDQETGTISADGRFIAYLQDDNNLHIRDREKNKDIAEFVLNDKVISFWPRELKFIEGGKKLVTLGYTFREHKHDTIQIWDIENKKLFNEWAFKKVEPK